MRRRDSHTCHAINLLAENRLENDKQAVSVHRTKRLERTIEQRSVLISDQLSSRFYTLAMVRHGIAVLAPARLALDRQAAQAPNKSASHVRKAEQVLRLALGEPCGMVDNPHTIPERLPYPRVEPHPGQDHGPAPAAMHAMQSTSPVVMSTLGRCQYDDGAHNKMK
jgi:hypothetical protein